MHPPARSRVLRFMRHFFLRWLPRTLAGLILLGATGYAIERWRGRKALDAARTAYRAEGISLDFHSYFPAPVTREDNFCATPSLAGIALSADSETAPGGVELDRKLARLQFNLWFPAYDNYAAPATRPVPWREVLNSLKGPRRVRSDGSRKGQQDMWSVPADAPDSAAAVYEALNAEKALFDELIAAVHRPEAVFTPQPAEGISLWDDRCSLYYRTRKLKDLLHARIACASETRRYAEAAALTHVLWRLRKAFHWEAVHSGSIAEIIYMRAWCQAVADILVHAPPEETLRKLLAQARDWNPEADYLRSMQASAAVVSHFWETLADEAGWTFSGTLRASFRAQGFKKVDDTRTMLLIPSGWFLQSGAQSLERRLKYEILPVLKGGFCLLPAADAAFRTERAEESLLSRITHPYSLHPGEAKLACKVIQMVRLTIVALAMELHRTSAGNYPPGLDMLVPEYLPAVPPDLDRAPLKALISPDRKSAVIYSVGWNLADDWHGIPPEASRARSRDEDWTMSLPHTPSAQ